jgi:hypothetical protein
MIHTVYDSCNAALNALHTLTAPSQRCSCMPGHATSPRLPCCTSRTPLPSRKPPPPIHPHHWRSPLYLLLLLLLLLLLPLLLLLLRPLLLLP